MLVALLLMAQVAGADTLATCRVPDDPQQRTFSLVRRDGAWVVVFRSRTLDQPSVALPIGAAQVSLVPFTVSYKSANGGRSIEWTASTINLQVNHGLEVNVERDLDPSVDLMNTDGPIDVACQFDGGSTTVRQRFNGGSELTASVGMAQSVNLFQSTSGRAYAVQTISWGRELTQEWGPGSLRGRFTWAVEAMPVFAQFSPSSI